MLILYIKKQQNCGFVKEAFRLPQKSLKGIF